MKLFILIVLIISYSANLYSICTISKLSNVRYGPSIRYKKKWPLYKYTPLRTIKKYEDWYKVKEFNKEESWVNKKNITKKFLCAIVKTDHANKRSGPGKKHPATPTKARREDTFKVLKIVDRKWVNVENEKGETFWIYRYLLWIY